MIINPIMASPIPAGGAIEAIDPFFIEEETAMLDLSDYTLKRCTPTMSEYEPLTPGKCYILMPNTTVCEGPTYEKELFRVPADQMMKIKVGPTPAFTLSYGQGGLIYWEKTK